MTMHRRQRCEHPHCITLQLDKGRVLPKRHGRRVPCAQDPMWGAVVNAKVQPDRIVSDEFMASLWPSNLGSGAFHVEPGETFGDVRQRVMQHGPYRGPDLKRMRRILYADQAVIDMRREIIRMRRLTSSVESSREAWRRFYWIQWDAMRLGQHGPVDRYRRVMPRLVVKRVKVPAPEVVSL